MQLNSLAFHEKVRAFYKQQLDLYFIIFCDTDIVKARNKAERRTSQISHTESPIFGRKGIFCQYLRAMIYDFNIKQI